jgi:flagellar motor switch protein FliN/FliY
MADEKDQPIDPQALADELMKLGSFADAGNPAPAAASSSTQPAAESDPNAPNLAELEALLKQASFEMPASASSPAVSQEERNLADRLMAEAQGGTTSAPLPPTSQFDLPAFEKALSSAQASSIDLLRDVDLNVKIELGRSRMLVEDVLKLAEGSVVELDKLAGDPVDVFVNDRLVARGEVLVLNDNFCVRVNEIISAIKEEA